MRNITPAFTVIVILNVERVCVSHNSNRCYELVTHTDISTFFQEVLSPRNSKPLALSLCSANMTSTQCPAMKSAIVHFLPLWLTSRGGPLKLNPDPWFTLQSIGIFSASYQIHVLCPNIRIWICPPMDPVFVCNKSLPGDRVEGFFSLGGSRRGWGFWFKRRWEHRVDYRNVAAKLLWWYGADQEANFTVDPTMPIEFV